ncbi:MAG: hypothetical protein K6F10_01995 [Paludibacteraceae bacterium]|nr:hypothetical protein [Paludibacteraceae bacterium]
MKTLRYLLIVIAMAGFLSTHAQGLAQQPQAQMRSTSGMVYSGSTLPQAAATGAMVTGTTPGTYTPANSGGPNRAKKGWGTGGESGEPGDRPEPYEDPLGDVMWPLALLAAAYALLRVYRRRCRV